ncbi:MAG TPA: malate synthase G [Acidimicrobiales bacterium]|nr:malate synthase G [Acidimicrobiales bacterium]
MTSADNYIWRGGLRVAETLDRFVAEEVLPPLGIDPEFFWSGFAEIVATFGPRNSALLEHRSALQEQLDKWHSVHSGAGDVAEYRRFLTEIGYLELALAPVYIDVDNVDPEIALIAGPQLVVPLDNARFALNAANARWISLYDALYGTNVIPELEGADRGSSYNPVRGERVIAFANSFLDQVVPLASGSYSEVSEFSLTTETPVTLAVKLSDDQMSELADPQQFVGFQHDQDKTHILLRNHGLHIELVVDRRHPIGQQNLAGVADVILEAAITTIQDCEDSVVTVDANDKTLTYRNWLGLMTGVLEATFEKDGDRFTRRLRADRSFIAPDGKIFTLPGRSLLLIRNVGLHMMTDIIQTEDGGAIPEGFLDALMTVTIAMHELRGLGEFGNSATGSIYVVKPKMHGSAEVAFTVEVLSAVERLLDLPENTVKIGIMDEERRTSLNLANCIAVARERVIFINTGFLDRTGDEIHTAMKAGPVVRKGDMRSTAWLLAYEQNNVDVALAMGFRGVAQIGKGMWAMPDAMAELVDTKIVHPQAGASCAWVPSPTAAALHAMHYHIVDVAARQDEIALQPSTRVDDLLELPLLIKQPTSVEIAEELANNAQSILGYVVRWVGQGIGCSKVPDIKGVALMEDRATLRISSQHIANWLLHGLLERDAIVSTFVEMAALVDEQNANDSAYRPMLPDAISSPGVSAALELVFDGARSPNGYTEDILNAWRRRVKAQGPTSVLKDQGHD